MQCLVPRSSNQASVPLLKQTSWAHAPHVAYTAATGHFVDWAMCDKGFTRLQCHSPLFSPTRRLGVFCFKAQASTTHGLVVQRRIITTPHANTLHDTASIWNSWHFPRGSGASLPCISRIRRRNAFIWQVQRVYLSRRKASSMDSTKALVSENHGKRDNATEFAAYSSIAFSNMALSRSHSSFHPIPSQLLGIDYAKHMTWALEHGNCNLFVFAS
jgi:hypothetical protein